MAWEKEWDLDQDKCFIVKEEVLIVQQWWRRKEKLRNQFNCQWSD
jgi:hypothetical protein